MLNGFVLVRRFLRPYQNSGAGVLAYQTR